MAIRRAKQKAQVIEKLARIVPPGERFLATVHTETGPSPWLNGLFDEVPLLGLIVALSRKFYFFTLTDGSVIVNSASRFTNRPGGVVAVFPRHSVPVSRFNRAAVWSKFYVQFPNGSKPTRLNVHRYWRGELDQLAAAFPVTASVIPAGGQAPGYGGPAQGFGGTTQDFAGPAAS